MAQCNGTLIFPADSRPVSIVPWSAFCACVPVLDQHKFTQLSDTTTPIEAHFHSQFRLRNINDKTLQAAFHLSTVSKSYAKQVEKEGNINS